MASVSTDVISVESSALNITLFVALAEKGTIEGSVLTSMIVAEQVSSASVINEFKNRLVIYTAQYRVARDEDDQQAEWTSPRTDAVKKRVTALYWLWNIVYPHLLDPARGNVTRTFSEILFPHILASTPADDQFSEQ